MEENFRKAALWIFVCGLLLRVALAVVNSEANDIHMNIIKIMAYENRLPLPHEDREAFQPKLYHGTVAALIKSVPRQATGLHVLIAQLLSCVAGIWTLLLAHRFLMSQVEVSEKVRFIAFSLLALNPVLIGINAQATNDSFVILFGSLAFYFGWHFFWNPRPSDFCWMLVAAALAGLSKANGLVIFIALLAVFIIGASRSQHNFPRSSAVLYGFVFSMCYLALVPGLGPYWQFYRLYGSPFVTNANLVVASSSSDKKSETPSMADALFTFRFFDLLKHPYRANRWQGDSTETFALYNRGPFPLHQNSAWSQLYGRTHFVHFDSWPPSWWVPIGEWPYGSWARPLVFDVGRLIFVCALLPTVLLLSGVFKSLFSATRWLTNAGRPERHLTEWLLDFTVVGYVLFLVAVFLKHPENVGWFKAIYIFPGFFAFLIFFARECDKLYGWLKEKKALRLSADAVFAVLLLLYVIDVAFLIGQLSLGVAYRLLHAA